MHHHQYGTAPRPMHMGHPAQQQFMTQQPGSNINAPWFPTNPMEQQYYDSLFDLADPHRQGAVGGANAVGFFGKSGLDKSVLREVSCLKCTMHAKI